jgi:hypothetical protein
MDHHTEITGHWLIAIIVSIALIYFMIRSPGFRYFIIGIVVLGGIAIYAWIENDKKESERRQQIATAQERAALSAISTTDIALDNVQLMKESSRWVLKGNVTNNSKYRLGSLGFMVRIEDCPPQKGCITIGQESGAGNRFCATGADAGLFILCHRLQRYACGQQPSLALRDH